MRSEVRHWTRDGVKQHWLDHEGALPMPERFMERYELHNASVRAYFRDRPDDLLEICFETEPEPWRRLCEFLDLDAVPADRFPHENRSPGVWDPALLEGWGPGADDLRPGWAWLRAKLAQAWRARRRRER